MINKKELDPYCESAAHLLATTPVGERIQFCDRMVRVAKWTQPKCCVDCVYAEERSNYAKCLHFCVCAAHLRTDKASVCFIDETALDAKNEEKRKIAREAYVHRSKNNKAKEDVQA